MNAADRHSESRADALARVLAYRERGRARAIPIRVAVAVLGAVLLVAAVPMIVALPEFGIPALLVAFRLLAVEADWAARAYAWTDWRCAQLGQWFHRQSRVARAVIMLGLLALAGALVWWLVVEFA
ncbi:hypothetical protein [Mycobacterium shigaense]|uniref:Uncharacterized protein n=1 Tax=Mycobacterium shigaense TaxID=722731 RepID=A0A1Z4EIQ9_9MYCO|nr:hypothetical protein [Mycobacterium shigaense]MEA1123597.1 hypothetical protein [Mycobacterium shigaense]PRI13730.1 hypothetical protein B2J96_18915 [Mycobacterium shigaense]BAX92858.1 hypothetical protein MSG_02714 [Mycobacterium shigaense]